MTFFPHKTTSSGEGQPPATMASLFTHARMDTHIIVIDYLMPVGVLISLARISSTTLSLALVGVSSTPYWSKQNK